MKRVLLIFLLFWSIGATAQRAVPPLWGHRVHDEAQVLSTTTAEELETLLKQHEDSTGNQIALLIIPSLDGEVLEEYSLRVAHDEWKLGSAKNDNGVLLLIAVDDRKMRIEVGHGLEGVLTDATTSRIIRNEIAPYFREQKYDEGIRAGIVAIVKAIGSEYEVDAADVVDVELTLTERLLFGAFIFGILGVFTFVGIFVKGCAGWFMYAFLIPFYAIFPMVVLGTTGGLSSLVAYMVGFPILKAVFSRSDWGQRFSNSMNKKRSSGGSGWSGSSGWSSGSSSGSSWGSSSGGSSFSGGGGSFGGGGSSGSW